MTCDPDTVKRIAFVAFVLGLVAGAAFLVIVPFADEWLHHQWSLPLMDAPARITARLLLWPSLLVGRIGFRHTLLITVLTACVVVIAGRRLGLRALQRRGGLLQPALAAVFPLLCYFAIAWCYVYLAPVPTPAFTEFDLLQSDREQHAAFVQAYRQAYRWGMIDYFINYDGVFSDGTRAGWLRGYAAGVAEWESVLPGVTVSSLKHRR